MEKNVRLHAQTVNMETRRIYVPHVHSNVLPVLGSKTHSVKVAIMDITFSNPRAPNNAIKDI
jgi:hypothetical protein